MTARSDAVTGKGVRDWPDADGASAPLTQLASADTAPEVLSGASQECYNRAGTSGHEVRMRPYGIVEEAPEEDEEYPQVVPLAGVGRSRAVPMGLGARPRPWAPRDSEPPPPVERDEPSPLTARQPGLTRTHHLMIACFAIVCVGMVLGMVMVRVWDEASRAVAALPPEGSAVSARKPGATTAQPVLSDSAAPQSAQDAVGAITTEIRVLQPNYTVAPGDTLGIIARKHGTSVDALASINNLENRNSLSVGQKLIIP
jgi:hypothetical protein